MRESAQQNQRRQSQDREAVGSADLFTRRAIIALGVTLLIVLVMLFLVYVLQVLMILFASILVALLLRIPTDRLSNLTPLPPRVSLAVVIIGILLLIIILGRLMAPSVASQLDQLTEILPEGVEELRDRLQRSDWGRQLLERFPTELPANAGNLLANVGGFFSNLLGILTSLLISVVIGFYLAYQPETYVNGLVRLFPPDNRPRVEETLKRIGASLRWWLIGRLFAMVVLGVMVGMGLSILRMPLALLLGVLMGLLSFVPVIGSIAALIPAVLVALTQDFTTLLYVLVLYLGAQTVETYVLTPMVQEYAASLPPALAFVAQLLLGVVAGPFGVALAFPLAVVGLVFVKTVYIEGVLGDEVDLPSFDAESEAQGPETEEP